MAGETYRFLHSINFNQRDYLLELAPVTLTLADNAAVIAGDYRIRGCDGVCVALAAQLDQILVTLDRQQLECAAEVVTVRKP